MANRAYKFRLYPNEEQKILFAKTFGSCRFVYNYFLDRCIKLYKEEEKSMTYYDTTAELTQLKKQPEDVAYFCKDWEQYRGCVIEHECAVRYGIKCIYA